MTTFKNNAKYAELLFLYLELAEREDIPISTKEVLEIFPWKFKGGDLKKIAAETRLKPEVSNTVFPDGTSSEILAGGMEGRMMYALKRVVKNRIMAGRMRNRSVLSRVSTYQMLTSTYGIIEGKPTVYTGMKSIYHIFGLIWEWSARACAPAEWETLEIYTKELLLGTAVVSRMHVPTIHDGWMKYVEILRASRLGGLLQAVKHMKELIKETGTRTMMEMARRAGIQERQRWDASGELNPSLTDQREGTRNRRMSLGHLTMFTSQGVAMLGRGEVRFALGRSDMERLHQLLMSAASLIVGVCSQAVVGTERQKEKALRAVQVTENNISRIVASSRKVSLGDEVLVCKGYRRAYTAFLGVLAGPMCTEETKVLIEEAKETAAPGVLDVEGFLSEAKTLDAANALNASKSFKICPAPDVSPGGALADRIKTIGDGNVVDHSMMEDFEAELRSQILRAVINSKHKKLKLRNPKDIPDWYDSYITRAYEKVPSDQIHHYLIWEGCLEMPEISPYDPSLWKDSGLGADTIRESNYDRHLGKKSNMITRLLFDDECPMPGKEVLSEEHVIKFFVKAEGHKDPARGIFSANLVDRQAQSWMEKAVERVATNHPSFMIGQGVDDREAKVRQLTARPEDSELVPMYYSFDISGWSAKMPAEPQRISHKIWADLYGGHLFNHASRINEGAHIYVNLDGYKGWFKNTHANLEGFNGKEMTMILVALLSLSVKRWRIQVVEEKILPAKMARKISALLFAYIDDGLSRIDLPKRQAVQAFGVYKRVVIDTFAKCGFTVEVSKCFPSDRFAIFLNEVYLAGRHVVHGVRAAMGISAEPTERHTSLVERVTSVSTGVRGAVMAGLNPMSGVMLMAYHVLLHLMEWVKEKDPVILAGWSLCPRAWGGLGLPNMMQLFVSGSGSAFEESVGTLQGYARINESVKKAYLKMCRDNLAPRDAVSILTAPLSGKITDGYMVDSRVAVCVREALKSKTEEGIVSSYARRLLRYGNMESFGRYAEAIVPRDNREVIQEQMLNNLAESHPHIVFSNFARRMEKSMTVMTVVGNEKFRQMIRTNRFEASRSVEIYRSKTK